MFTKRAEDCAQPQSPGSFASGSMVQLGRELPELPGELLFSDGELRVLATFARSRTLPPPTRLGDAVGLVGRLGGWLGRTRDPPGEQLLWHGYTQLVAMAFAFELRDEYG